MKLNLCVVGAILLAGTHFTAFAAEPEPTPGGSDINQQLGDREQKSIQLSLEEQLKLRAAQQKAAEDPAVKAALEKRDQAIAEFRKAMHDSMLKFDPKLEPVLEKIAIGSNPGF
jgi:hypothetical protein